MQTDRIVQAPLRAAWSVQAALSSALLLAIGGCAHDTYLSHSGPSRTALVEEAQLQAAPNAPGQQLQYALIPLDGARLGFLEADEPAAAFPDEPGRQRSADGLIGVGDEISITVFESGSGGLFLPREGGTRSGNFVTIPTQQVGKDGTIEMPYAGTLRVAATTPRAVSATIQTRLANRALEPQVVVSVVDRRAGPVSVLGEVASGTRFALDPGGARILEAIARAGGPRFPAYESMVTLQRDSRVYKALLSEIAQTPMQNVELKSNDVVYVSHEPRYFLAMGATGQGATLGTVSRRFAFEDSHIRLADAVAKAGGLLDEQADAAGVFVYRSEPRDTVVAMGVKGQLPAMVPTVYLLNLRDPAGYFYASHFAVRDEDVIFVSNAPATDLAKFLNLLAPFTGSAASSRATVR
jgi:polysaccharide export outer membrane protein